MPGALLLIVAICLYGLRTLDLIFLGTVAAFHFLLGLVYICLSLLFLPHLSAVEPRPAQNPFAALPPEAGHKDEPDP